MKGHPMPKKFPKGYQTDRPIGMPDDPAGKPMPKGRKPRPAPPADPSGGKGTTPSTKPKPTSYGDAKRALSTPGMQAGEQGIVQRIMDKRGVGRAEARAIGARRVAAGKNVAGIRSPKNTQYTPIDATSPDPTGPKPKPMPGKPNPPTRSPRPKPMPRPTRPGPGPRPAPPGPAPKPKPTEGRKPMKAPPTKGPKMPKGTGY